MSSQTEPTGQFTDRKGTVWTVALDVGLLEQVKTEAGIDLSKAMHSTADLGKLLYGGDLGLLVRIFYSLLHDQVEKAALTPEQFARLFDGATIERATESLIVAIADFFPRSRVGAAIRADLPMLLTEMDNLAISRWRTGISSVSVTNLPGSSALTHGG